MNGEGQGSDLSGDDESYAYLRRDFVTSVDFGSQNFDFRPPISLGFIPALPQAFFELPPIRYEPAGSSDAAGDSATPGTEAVQPIVVDPEEGPQTTVFESPYWAERTRETDWDYVYDQYVILNAPERSDAVIEVPEVAIDWGEIAGSIIGGIFDPFGAGAATTSYFNPPGVVPSAQAVPNLGGPAAGITGGAAMAGCPPTGPKYGKICLATGEITPLRRRRRRRLLTSSDIKDLSALKSIVGGAALQGAVVQAVRR